MLGFSHSYQAIAIGYGQAVFLQYDGKVKLLPYSSTFLRLALTLNILSGPEDFGFALDDLLWGG